MRHLVFVLLLAVVGCREHQASDDRPASSGAMPTEATTVVFERAGGGELAKVSVDGGTVTIDGRGAPIIGEPKGAKRRYHQAGSFVAEVKADGDKLKLKNEGGELLWKVKITDDKVKVSDNEENANAFEIKTKADGLKVTRGDAEIGKVKGDGGRVTVEAADGTEAFGGKGEPSAAWAVLLLDEVPEAQRLVIAAELVLRGR